MSTSEPEAASERGTGAPIPLPRFEKVLRGFDPQAVNSFLKTVLGRLRDLESQVTDLQTELDEARRHRTTQVPARAGSEDRYEIFSGHVADVVRAFDQDVERIRNEAETEAKRIVGSARSRAEADAREAAERSRKAKTELERLLNEARTEADRIRVDAQAKAEEVRAEADRALEDARAQATEHLSDLEARRGTAMTELRSLRDRVLEAAGRLDAALEGRPAVTDVTVAEGGVAVSEGPGSPTELSGRGR